MPKFQYQNREMPVFELVPEGDYKFEVIAAESSLSQGNATKGCDQLELKIDISKAVIPDSLIFPAYDDEGRLQTDAKAAKFLEAKIDCFINCTGLASAKGQVVELTSESVIGLRGWCRVIQDELPPKPNKPPMKVNKIHLYYTNKDKIGRRVIDKHDVPKSEANPFLE